MNLAYPPYPSTCGALSPLLRPGAPHPPLPEFIDSWTLPGPLCLRHWALLLGPICFFSFQELLQIVSKELVDFLVWSQVIKLGLWVLQMGSQEYRRWDKHTALGPIVTPAHWPAPGLHKSLCHFQYQNRPSRGPKACVALPRQILYFTSNRIHRSLHF